MKFKNIFNLDVVDIKNCEEELIHIPGSIQPHGLLLGLQVNNFTIEYCSKNSFKITGLKYEQCLGNGLESLLG